MPSAPPAQPLPAPDARDLPYPLTIFLSGRERAQVLRRLRRIDGDRRIALLTAMDLLEHSPNANAPR